jgi:hypothetical protein
MTQPDPTPTTDTTWVDTLLDQALDARDWLRGAESAADVRQATEMLAQSKQALLNAHREKVIKARKHEVSKFAQAYRPIMKPIKESPMELTQEAITYNKIAQDIILYENSRLEVLNRKLSTLTQSDKEETDEKLSNT